MESDAEISEENTTAEFRVKSWENFQTVPKPGRRVGAADMARALTDNGSSVMHHLVKIATGQIKGIPFSTQVDAGKYLIDRMHGKTPETVVNVDLDGSGLVPDEAVGATLESLIRQLQAPRSVTVNALPSDATSATRAPLETPDHADPMAVFAAVEESSEDETPNE